MRNRQQHYTAHDDDITSLSLCLKPRVAATGQCGRVARVQIWGIDSRATISTISNPAIQRRITALSWSRTGSHLVAVGGDDNRTAFVFSFSRRTSAAQSYKENILGSSSKDANEDVSRHPTLNFSSPQLLFSVALQVHALSSRFFIIHTCSFTCACSRQTCSRSSSIRSVETTVLANFGLLETKWLKAVTS